MTQDDDVDDCDEDDDLRGGHGKRKMFSDEDDDVDDCDEPPTSLRGGHGKRRRASDDIEDKKTIKIQGFLTLCGGSSVISFEAAPPPSASPPASPPPARLKIEQYTVAECDLLEDLRGKLSESRIFSEQGVAPAILGPWIKA
jgi:hypothetical protein